jgi:Do/DeqQ family serine protease
MKKILSLVLISALGGILTLGAYKLIFNEQKEITAGEMPGPIPLALPVNYDQAGTNVVSATNVDFTEAAEKTIHTVVHVKNTTISTGQMTLEDLFYGRRSQRPQIGSGSGVIISPDGYIITNNHVIAGAQSITITTNQNKTYDAELVGTDPKTDIALLKIDPEKDLAYTMFGDSDNARIGEWVLAVGNPFNLTSTVTAGIISAKSRDLVGGETQSFIQTDAAVNPGNSGGALVNTRGELIGINTAITSQTGNYVGYSFAVPSNIARKVVEDIMEYGNVQNGILGITGGSLDSEAAEDLGIKQTEGFYINEVVEDSGADLAGLQSGDIIKRLDNIKISKFSDLKGYLNTKRPNDVIAVTILRNGYEETIPVKLLKNETINVPVLGILKNASKEELREFKLDYGVKIASLTRVEYYNKYWRNNDIGEGTIITAINDTKISSVEDVERIMDNRSSNEPLRIELVNKNGEKERYNFR